MSSLPHQDELALARAAYAKKVLAEAGVDNARLERAYATVKREDFLGPGPWKVVRSLTTYEPTPDANPVHLYTNDLFGILPEQQLNNGQPSFHVAIMNTVLPAEGEHVVHVGAGVGYYSAIFAELVGTRGRVTAIEFLPELAGRARTNLRSYANVEVMQGDGSTLPFAPADVIYVNAGATRPADLWLDQLKEGGRLLLPLTTSKSFSDAFDRINAGVVFRIERRGDQFLVRWVSTVAIFPCAGSRDEASERALAQALSQGGEQSVTRLFRPALPPEEPCWLRAPDWCLR